MFKESQPFLSVVLISGLVIGKTIFYFLHNLDILVLDL